MERGVSSSRCAVQVDCDVAVRCTHLVCYLFGCCSFSLTEMYINRNSKFRRQEIQAFDRRYSSVAQLSRVYALYRNHVSVPPTAQACSRSAEEMVKSMNSVA